MAYLTANKQLEIERKVRATSRREVGYLLDELALMEASLISADAKDYGEVGDIAAVNTAAAAGTSSEIARADHVHALSGDLIGGTNDIADIGKTASGGSSAKLAKADHVHKLVPALFKSAVITGSNGAGACALTGAVPGDVVIMCANLTDAANGAASFETTVTVADQLQQTDVANLSAKKFAVLIMALGVVA